MLLTGQTIQSRDHLQAIQAQLQEAVQQKVWVKLFSFASSEMVHSIFFCKSNRQLYQLKVQLSPTVQGVWEVFKIESGAWKLVEQEDWNYSFYHWEEKIFLLSVTCGRSAVYEIKHVLSLEEVQSYRTKGKSFLQSKSGSINASPTNPAWNRPASF